MTVVVGEAVVPTGTFIPSLDHLICVLPTNGSWNTGRGVADAIVFVRGWDGLSNDRCNDSGSKKEYNGKFDLNHF